MEFVGEAYLDVWFYCVLQFPKVPRPIQTCRMFKFLSLRSTALFRLTNLNERFV